MLYLHVFTNVGVGFTVVVDVVVVLGVLGMTKSWLKSKLKIVENNLH